MRKLLQCGHRSGGFDRGRADRIAEAVADLQRLTRENPYVGRYSGMGFPVLMRPGYAARLALGVGFSAAMGFAVAAGLAFGVGFAIPESFGRLQGRNPLVHCWGCLFAGIVIIWGVTTTGCLHHAHNVEIEILPVRPVPTSGRLVDFAENVDIRIADAGSTCH
jgi:hypothetical protein